VPSVHGPATTSTVRSFGIKVVPNIDVKVPPIPRPALPKPSVRPIVKTFPMHVLASAWGGVVKQGGQVTVVVQV
jgi:hypothetical protein